MTTRGKGIGGHEAPGGGATVSWLTPPEILRALGEFDYDPCPCLPQPYPTASVVERGDGLASEWFGRVWLNPPYGPDLGAWLARLADHGNGIAICFARTETRAFFESVWGRASGLLFLRGRLHFHRPDGTRAKGNAGAPSVLIAYGDAMAHRLQSCGLAGAYVPGGLVLGSLREGSSVKKRVYIAGPISKGDLRHNINQATEAFVLLAKAGFAPMCPHWSVYSKPAGYELFRTTANAEMLGFTRRLVCEATAMGNDEMSHADWMGVDLPWVAVSDAVLRLPGESAGADLEVKCAGEHGIPVFLCVEALVEHFAEAEAA